MSVTVVASKASIAMLAANVARLRGVSHRSGKSITRFPVTYTKEKKKKKEGGGGGACERCARVNDANMNRVIDAKRLPGR
jgi:hypothetical protein